MAITPEEIEARIFSRAPRGYDCEEVDRFLAEVAASYRFAIHNLLPGVRSDAPGGADPFGDLGERVAEILRATERVAERRRATLEDELAARRAEADAALVQAQREVDAERNRAVEVLRSAEKRAADLLAEAEARAEDRMTEAEAEARRHVEAAEAARRRREQHLTEVESRTMARLRGVRAEVDRVLDQFEARPGPLLDLTGSEPVLRPSEGRNGHSDSGARRTDPVEAMVLAAVGRAAEKARRDPAGEASSSVA